MTYTLPRVDLRKTARSQNKFKTCCPAASGTLPKIVVTEKYMHRHVQWQTSQRNRLGNPYSQSMQRPTNTLTSLGLDPFPFFVIAFRHDTYGM